MLVIDFEVFKYDWMLIGLDLKTKEYTKIHNDKQALLDLYNKYKHDLFIAYNGTGYDMWIFKGILLGFNPKDINDYIIVKGKNGRFYSNLFRTQFNMNMYDPYLDLNKSLKSLECNMGEDIQETEVDFNIDRPLTKDEVELTFKYNKHDVDQLALVFHRTIDTFKAYLDLIKLFNLPTDCFSLTKAQLTAKILGAKKKKFDDEFNITLPEFMIVKENKDVVDFFLSFKNTKLNPEQVYKTEYKKVINEVEHIFRWGGLHGARENYHVKGRLVNFDVAAYYPSQMIEYDYLSRCVSDRNRYKEIYNMRLDLKAKKDHRQASLKLVLNGTYGAQRQKASALYDPLMGNEICIVGQLLLLDLIEKVQYYSDIVNANTDGVLVLIKGNTEEEQNYNESQVLKICNDWQNRTKMKLEFDYYTEIYQKDVNNYLIIDKVGKTKAKGILLKEQNSLDNDLPIIKKALKDYMAKGIPIRKTIEECDDLIMYQKVCRLSSKFDYVLINNVRQANKTFRVFASLREEDGKIEYFKHNAVTQRKNGAVVSDKKVKAQSTSDKIFVDNSNIMNKKAPAYLDKEFYINLCEKYISLFGV